MKYKVIKPFIDKNTKIGYSKNSFFESDDEKRITFLSEQGFIEKPKDAKKVSKNAPSRKKSTSNKS